MAKRKKRIKTDDPLRNLEKAMRRLDADQGMVARRNGRADVLAEIRKLRAHVDREYPTIKSSSSTRRKRRTGQTLFNHLRKNGWVPTTDEKVVEACATAGVTVKRIQWTVDVKNKVKTYDKEGNVVTDSRGNYVYETQITKRTEKRLLVPDWADAVWRRRDRSVTLLKKAKKSRIERDAVMVESQVAAISVHTPSGSSNSDDSDDAMGLQEAS